MYKELDNFEQILKDNKVELYQDEEHGWGLSWQYGCMHIGVVREELAKKAAALFVLLWLRGFDAALSDELMQGYLLHLEYQAGDIVKIEYKNGGGYTQI